MNLAIAELGKCTLLPIARSALEGRVPCIVEAVLRGIFFSHIVLLPPGLPAIHVYRRGQGTPVRLDALVREASWVPLLAGSPRGGDVLLEESKNALVSSCFRGIDYDRIVFDGPAIHAFRS